MTNRRKIQALTYELESTFGTDPASSPTRLLLADIPTFTLEQDRHEQDLLTMEVADLQAVLGAKGGKVNFRTRLRGNGTAAGNGQAMAATELSPLMEGCGFKPVIAAYKEGSAVVSTGASSVTVSAAEGANWNGDAVTDAYGQAMVSKANGAAKAEVNVAAGIVADAITVVRAWTVVPTNTDDLYNTRTVFLPPTPEDLDTYFKSFSITIYRDDAKFVLSGCSGSWSIKTEARGLLVVDFEFQVDSWTVAAAASPAATLSNDTRGINVIASPFYLGDAAITVSGVEIDLGLEIQPQLSVGATHGRAKWALLGFKPKIKIREYFSKARHDQFTAQTKVEVMGSFGVTAGSPGIFGLYMPVAELISANEMEINGMVGIEYELRPLAPASQSRTNWPGDIFFFWG